MFPSPGFVDRLSESLQRDLIGFLPEYSSALTIVGMLLARLFTPLSRTHLGWFALVMTALAFAAGVAFWPGVSNWFVDASAAHPVSAFSGLLVFDTFGLFFRLFLLASLGLSIWLSLTTGIPDREDSADYITLLVGGTLGMMLMASAGHPADDVRGRRDGERPELRLGRVPQGPPAEARRPSSTLSTGRVPPA